MLTISLLHATYLSPIGPLRHRDAWLSLAESPGRIEYIAAMDESDRSAITETERILRAINHPRDTMSTAVQNWNSAAKLSSGDLLFVISDDLLPGPGWDTQIDALVMNHDPTANDFAIKVQDSPTPSETTLRHPLVSRRFYEKFGLFDDSFRGVFCDNDITFRALLYSKILDGRIVKFSHAHPHFDTTVSETLSHYKINRSEEYAFGRNVFQNKYWPFHLGVNLNKLTLPTGTQRAGLLLLVRRGGIFLKSGWKKHRGESTRLTRR